jgi:hypothetical protein
MARVNKNKMRNEQVVQESLLRGRISRCFYDGYYLESHTGNLCFTATGGNGGKMINYVTTLLEWNREHTALYINKTKYSNTTSKIQSLIWKYVETLPKDVVIYEVHGMTQGCYTLINPTNYEKLKNYSVIKYDRN